MDFQLAGDKNNPFHISAGMVLINETNQLALIRKNTGIVTLPRETMYLQESFYQSIQRGAEEELGLKIEPVRYMGSLKTYFLREDNTRVEKTTLYFLVKKISAEENNRLPMEDEVEDQTIWVELDEAESLLKSQDNPEFEILEKLAV
jgi:hypothetical protein